MAYCSLDGGKGPFLGALSFSPGEPVKKEKSKRLIVREIAATMPFVEQRVVWNDTADNQLEKDRDALWNELCGVFIRIALERTIPNPEDRQGLYRDVRNQWYHHRINKRRSFDAAINLIMRETGLTEEFREEAYDAIISTFTRLTMAGKDDKHETCHVPRV